MEKLYKRIHIIYWIVFIATYFLAMHTAFAEFPDDTQWTVFILWAVAMVAGIVLVELLFAQHMTQKLNALMPSLYLSPDQYITDLKELLSGKRISKQYHQVLCINLCAAYCRKKDFKTAKKYLSQVNTKKLGSTFNRAAYWADLALVHFELEEQEEACAILKEQQKLFSRWKEDKRIGALLAILHIWELVAKNQYQEAATLLKEARPRWETENNAEDFAFLEEQITNML
jgi:tetratricopeptide (TPR) repeat protein